MAKKIATKLEWEAQSISSMGVPFGLRLVNPATNLPETLITNWIDKLETPTILELSY